MHYLIFLANVEYIHIRPNYESFTTCVKIDFPGTEAFQSQINYCDRYTNEGNAAKLSHFTKLCSLINQTVLIISQESRLIINLTHYLVDLTNSR